MVRTFHVLIEQDEDDVFVGKVPELQGCLSQGDTLDELMKNIKEAAETVSKIIFINIKYFNYFAIRNYEIVNASKTESTLSIERFYDCVLTIEQIQEAQPQDELKFYKYIE